MVDFKKHLNRETLDKPTDPIQLYSTLDRASDKGPLRPAQHAVLSEWASEHIDDRDLIVKLHTGQGKTLVGLLMLQSKLNADQGPVVYLCPDQFLISQTCEQAAQFGISTCIADNELPESFIDGKKILVTSVQKLFNGLSKFGLNRNSLPVGAILMDDAHACADRIREACAIKIEKNESAYSQLKTLFATDLEAQGVGTFAEIENGGRDAILPVPYWAWTARESEVAAILASQIDKNSVKFAWPLLKDTLKHCQCVISGSSIEIEPRIAPLKVFGSFTKADQRIFMSATVTDDAFLVKGLGLSPQVISHPLTDHSETWSGEKMVIIPALIHEDLDEHSIRKTFGVKCENADFGIVALTPSFSKAEIWKKQGAHLVNKGNIEEAVRLLISKKFDHTLVLSNRYDGIDLPDASCRVLIFDGCPYSENLIDKLAEQTRADSETTLIRTVRTIEQGIGRSVRGEKDYSVIILTGTDLVRLIRGKNSRKYLSAQVAKQIEIGLEVSEMARKEVESEAKIPAQTLVELGNQCLHRDESWKAFYAEQMDGTTPTSANKSLLKLYAAELEAERKFVSGDSQGAADYLQEAMDAGLVGEADKAWFLQEKARYLYEVDRPQAQNLQVAAHRKNMMLLKPSTGVSVAQLKVVSHGRTKRISDWIKEFSNYQDMNIAVSNILSRLRFGVRARDFEAAMNELANALGFKGEQPDREWKEGPDNLWALDDRNYLVIEAKNEVHVHRAEINKRESEQMNRSASWFDKHYPGLNATRLIVHPASKIESAASFTHEVQGITAHDLKSLVRACESFFRDFEHQDFNSLSSEYIQSLINSHNLTVSDLQCTYSRSLKNQK